MKKNVLCRLLGLVAAGVMLLAVLPGANAAEQEKAEKAKPYPLETCVVSGSKLGEMGDPYVFVHKGQQIKLCCKGCLKAFNKEPEKFMKKIEEADQKKK